MVITPKSLTLTQLLSAESEQYIVPAYQRRYSWREKQLCELLDDVSLLEGADTHLLGSIVCLTGYHTAGINQLELVDGQQRLTTICILLQCIADRLKMAGEINAAQDVERLLQSRAIGEPPVRKILLDSMDSPEFEQLMAGQNLDHADNRNLALAFSTFRNWVNNKELKDLGSFLYHLKNQCIIIRLDVSDAKDAFKLFETINNRGLKLSPTDIIKNFILGNAARFGPEHLKLARTKWADLLHRLDGTNIESFFRHFLCVRSKRRITISFVIPNFKTIFMQQVTEAAQLPGLHWYSDEPSAVDEAEDGDDVLMEIGDAQPIPAIEKMPRISLALFLEQVVVSAGIYGQIVHAKTGDPGIDRELRDLRMIKAIQTYGFLTALRVGGCDDSIFRKVLQLTQSFLLRRHICRERANDNETLFARLCGVDPLNPLDAVVEEFRRYCPSDEKFMHEFARFEFTSALIERARYCLEQFEQRRQGKHLELIVGGADIVHVEHIIPQKIKTKKAKDDFGDWPAYLGLGSETKHPHFVSRIGNLTLFAGALNIGASNNPYERKKASYFNSAIKLTNSLPNEFPEFRFEQVEKRSAEFAQLAVELWPSP